MSRPGDGTRNGRHIVTDGSCILSLVLLIVLLDLVDQLAVVGEQKLILSVQGLSQVGSVENRLELSEEHKRISDAHSSLEFLVDVSLEISLDGRDIDVESDEISIELVLAVLKESMLHPLETIDILVEGVDDMLDILELMLTKSLELLNSFEQKHEFNHSSAEEIKTAEDLLG
jgi:hypothetical protein